MEAPGGDFRLTGNGILPSALIVPGIVGAGTCADQQTHDQPRMQAGAGRAIRLSAKWDLEEVSRGARFAGAALLRFVRSAQHRVIDLGSTRHEQNRSRSPCSVFSSTRPPWPSDFLNCWPPLAGRESPKPCKDQGPRADACECGSVYPSLLPTSTCAPCLPVSPFIKPTSLSPLLKSPEKEREREWFIHKPYTLVSTNQERELRERDSSYTKGNPNTCAISKERQGERALAFIHRVWHPWPDR